VKQVRLGCGLAFWGDNIQPATDMAERGDIDYLCCDHLAELTMSILNKQKARDPSLGYTGDVLDLLRSALPICREKGIRVITNAGGANPRSCAEKIAELCGELGLHGIKIALVTGDDILDRIDELMALGVEFASIDTGEPLSTVRDRLTHANVYIGCEGIVEALERGADIVVCGRVTDMALYLGPMRHELGWAADDWQLLGAGTAIAHAVECGGQATGGLYSGGWPDVPNLERIGYPIVDVLESGDAVITKTPGSGGEVSIGTLSEQLVYEVLDPGSYLTADATADITDVRLEQVGADQVRMTGVRGLPRPATLKVNMGYRAGFVGEAQFTYTWPHAYAKAQGGIALLEKRLEMAGFEADAVRVEYLGWNSMWTEVLPPPETDELNEIVVRYAARCASPAEARKVYHESVPLYNNGPAGVGGIGTRPPVKELFGLWPCLIPRELVPVSVDMVESP
jgi:hypothetical protein